MVGPYQGSINDLTSFNKSLERLQEITGWPVFADPVSGVYSDLRGLVVNWELVLRKNKNSINCHQLLRLGLCHPQLIWRSFKNFEGIQILIKEKNYRKLDPIKKSFEYDFGLSNFTTLLLEELSINEKTKSLLLIGSRSNRGRRADKEILKEKIIKIIKLLSICSNLVPKLWPAENPIMLQHSPIRDWLTFSENGTLTRNCFSFRGTSGIDGTLSLALGISRIKILTSCDWRFGFYS